MWDLDTWLSVGKTAWDRGGQLGVGGLLGWLLRRWVGSRDKALDRGRSLVDEARPEVIPTGGSFTYAGGGSWTLDNRGPGTAYDVCVTFTDSTRTTRLPEVLARPPRHVHTPDVDLSDSTFFRELWTTRAELTVSYKDRYGIEYVTTLPVQQESRAGGGFNMRPDWGRHRLTPPKIAKKRLREIGDT